MERKKKNPTPLWVGLMVVLATPLIFLFKRFDIYGENPEPIIMKYGLLYLFLMAIGIGVLIWKYVFDKKDDRQ